MPIQTRRKVIGVEEQLKALMAEMKKEMMTEQEEMKPIQDSD